MKFKLTIVIYIMAMRKLELIVEIDELVQERCNSIAKVPE